MPFDAHTIFDVISGLAALAWLIAGLALKSAISDIKLIISDFRGKFDAHVQIDDLKHEQIDEHLAATDSRVTRLEYGIKGKGYQS